MSAPSERTNDERRRLLVTISCLNAAADTRGARLYKALGWPEPELAVLLEIADGLGIPAARRRHEISRAHEIAQEAVLLAERRGIHVLTCLDPDYPPLLQTISDPPIVLWMRGDPAALSAPAVAVVGARAATPSGVNVARRLGADLAAAGLVVVSGLARGVDGAAHAGALAAGGRSVAVLGCGVDVAYPAEHVELAQELVAHGVVMSELPPGSPPLAHHFPLRNRIISGLVRAVVVIEAGERSGSLITARMALEQGRDVLAVPGSVATGRYRGSHALIKDGARLVETVEDVLDELKWSRPAGFAPAGSAVGIPNLFITNGLEGKMASGEPYSLDDLAAATGRPAAVLLAELATLELAGRVSRLPGGDFVRLDEPARYRG